MAGEGWTNDDAMNNRMMSVFQEVGKEHNLDQGTYEALFNGMTEMQSRVQAENLTEIVKSIPNYDDRAKAMVDTSLRFLRPDQAQAIDSLMQSKESFEAVEILMGALRGGSLPLVTQGVGDISDGDLRQQIKALNPADTSKRAELMGILNSRGNGEGKLV